jgi:serine/threonine protein kinase
MPDATHPLPPADPATLALTEALPPPTDEPTELAPLAPPAAAPKSDHEAPTIADIVSVAPRRQGPAEVPGYQLIECLGLGTYGEVWLGQEERTGIRVAIKFLNHDTGIEWQLIQAEVKQLALLHTDPGIVQLLDVELERRPPYYIMAFAEQGSLARRLEQGPLPLAEALDIFKQLAEALAYVHAKGVRHCDLKPGNVLLKARKRVLLADFGQSQLCGEATPALGTFFYMAPEQADLAKQIPDTRWDVYGLGAIFYAMLTGKPPREDDGVREELGRIKRLPERLAAYRAAVQRAPLPDKHRGVAGMDRHLADILDRCLEIDPVRRLRDAGAVLAALTRRERLQSQRPLLVFGFVAQILVCLLVGGMAFWGTQNAIRHAEEGLQAQLAQDAVVRRSMSELRAEMVTLGVAITAGVMLVLSALWGWLIWTLRRKE